MRNVRRSLAGTATAAAALTLFAASCMQVVEGDSDPTYGEVTFTVASYDESGAELSRDVRTGAGADLVGPLDRDLFDPITVDGQEVSDASELFAAREARIGDVVLTRDQDRLRASGETLLAVRSAARTGAALSVELDGGRFEIAVAGQLSAASIDRILGSSLVRLVRGEALLADDCRPDCAYDFNPGSWLCAPIRDALISAAGGDCTGPYTPEAWAAIEDGVRNQGKRDYCYDLWYVPRPICEWSYDMAADAVFPHLEPDASGQVCASAFYDRCTGAVAE